MPERVFDERLSCRESGRGLLIHFCPPTIPFFQGELDLQRMSIAFALNRTRLFATKRLKQRERDVNRLIIFRLGGWGGRPQSANGPCARGDKKVFAGADSRGG